EEVAREERRQFVGLRSVLGEVDVDGAEDEEVVALEGVVLRQGVRRERVLRGQLVKAEALFEQRLEVVLFRLLDVDPQQVVAVALTVAVLVRTVPALTPAGTLKTNWNDELAPAASVAMEQVMAPVPPAGGVLQENGGPVS